MGRCKEHKPTIVIISTRTNNVFGGYTSIKWQRDDQWRKDEDAFLFLVRSSKNYKPDIFRVIPRQSKYAMCHYSGYMVTFGLGHDIYMRFTNGKIMASQQIQGTYSLPKKRGYLNGDSQSID